MALITNAGHAIVTNRIKNGDTGATEPNFLAWGTGATAEAAGDTALETPAAEARVAGTSSRVTTAETDDTYEVTGTITSGSTQTISEVGLFDASSGGNLYMRDAFTGVELNNGESITFTISVQYA